MDQLWPLTVTVPPGTLQSAPQVTPWRTDDAPELSYFDIIVPNGHNGLTGIKLLWSGTEIVPWDNTAFLTANDEKIHVEFGGYITVNALTVVTYNTDIFAHSFYLRALIKQVLPASMCQPVDLASLVMPDLPNLPLDPLSPDCLLGDCVPPGNGGTPSRGHGLTKNIPPTRHHRPTGPGHKKFTGETER